MDDNNPTAKPAEQTHLTWPEFAALAITLLFVLALVALFRLT